MMRRLSILAATVLIVAILTGMILAALTLVPGGVGAALAQAENPSFNLVNRAGMAVKELYVTPAGDANWGRNRLAGTTIAAGASYPVRRRIDGNCIFDLRVVFADGRIEDRRDLNTCQTEDVAVGAPPGGPPPGGAGKAADDPSFRLINHGEAAIIEAYATPSGLGNWGHNRLENAPLEPQANRLIHVDKQGTCKFDLRVVFTNGHKLERRHADLCRITDLPVP
jgi:hypothetical protein